MPVGTSGRTSSASGVVSERRPSTSLPSSGRARSRRWMARRKGSGCGTCSTTSDACARSNGASPWGGYSGRSSSEIGSFEIPPPGSRRSGRVESDHLPTQGLAGEVEAQPIAASDLEVTPHRLPRHSQQRRHHHVESGSLLDVVVGHPLRVRQLRARELRIEHHAAAVARREAHALPPRHEGRRRDTPSGGVRCGGDVFTEGAGRSGILPKPLDVHQVAGMVADRPFDRAEVRRRSWVGVLRGPGARDYDPPHAPIPTLSASPACRPRRTVCRRVVVGADAGAPREPHRHRRRREPAVRLGHAHRSEDDGGVSARAGRRRAARGRGVAGRPLGGRDQLQQAGRRASRRR